MLSGADGGPRPGSSYSVLSDGEEGCVFSLSLCLSLATHTHTRARAHTYRKRETPDFHGDLWVEILGVL